MFHFQGRVFRTVMPRAVDDYRFVRDAGLLDRLIADGHMISCAELAADQAASLGLPDMGQAALLEHPALPFISYPYEWTFGASRAAALLHLDLHLTALDAGATLSDASAYNIQFQGARPLFIDLLSLRRYQDGEPWIGHRQFVEQFLAPLLLRASLGILPNAWYRGCGDGLPTAAVAKLLPWRWRLRPAVLAHVVLPARMQAKSEARGAMSGGAKLPKLPLRSYRGLLTQLRDFIAGLRPADAASLWGDYAESHSYTTEEQQARHAFVGEVVAGCQPRTVWDLGCNTGEFSVVALEAGARRVIGFDADPQALERAYARAEKERLDFLPLHMDLFNPSPDQGWASRERAGLMRRGQPDMVLAMAVMHHLAIGRNVPLPLALDWLVGLAPRGVVEFVPLDDPTVRVMLALRDASVFDGYGEDAFAAALRRSARIVRRQPSSRHGRVLYAYERSDGA